MKVVAIIQARMGSTRFPGKVMADLCGKPVLQHVIERVQEAKGIDEVVIACPDSEFVESVRFLDFGCGVIAPAGVDDNDVLGRFVKVAEITNADWIIRVCGDNPLVDPRGIEELVSIANLTTDVDYAAHYIDDDWVMGHPYGYFAELVSRSALELIHTRTGSTDPTREHVTKDIYRDEHNWHCLPLRCPDWYTPDTPNASIDTPEDLERVRAMMEVAHVS